MSDSSQSKEFEVTVQRGNRIEKYPIKAPSKKAAEAHAELLLKRKGGNPQKVIATTEKKP